ncbi:MAG: acetate/propionate family kinase [Oscillospiraceae bacterium]|nr:acetate/propionate family kinase [Oscillospiraceae bacterium]
MKKLFIMNLGTTSFKFKLYLFSEEAQRVLASGEIESVGADLSAYNLQLGETNKVTGKTHIPDHAAGFTFCVDALQQSGILDDMADLDAVGYKAVHGGSLSGTQPVDDKLLTEMERMSPLVPAHNPIYLQAMKDIRDRYPNLKQIARFETSFHGTIPDCRTTYGVPYQWRENLGIRKYGFHGSSHEYIAGKMQQLCPEAKRIISCHLGGSSSICAIKDGKSIATTMGATAQSGLFNNNRVGDFEVFCLPMLMEYYGGSLENVLNVLSKESGLLGLSGVSNDLRQALQAMDEGNERARLAVETLVDNIVGYIGMYTAYLGGLDALVFTGGIGLHSDRIRKMVCERLAYLGLALDAEKNAAANAERISSAGSSVGVYRLKTDEEIVVARNVYGML